MDINNCQNHNLTIQIKYINFNDTLLEFNINDKNKIFFRKNCQIFNQ